MPTRLAHPRQLDEVLQALARRRWALWLLLAAGCGMRTSLDRPGADSSVSAGGATSRGGAGGQGDGGPGVGAKGKGGSGGVTGVTGVTGTGGSVGGSGTLGAGGTSSRGGTTGSGGVGGSVDPVGSSVFGVPCATNQDCPSDATCCDGSDESCDGTRLPSGNGSNPGELVVSADGLTVTDTITGLVWQRDGSGTRSGCSGGYGGAGNGNLTCTWDEARAYCASLSLDGVLGWRLPAVKELSTIVDLTETNATIDPVVFPNTTADIFWGSSPSAGFPGFVRFDNGMSGILYSLVNNYRVSVRCVSGSRCYPVNRFVVVSGGLVHDTLTNLVWQQQTSTATMSLADAQTYCSSAGLGFRLPTLKELLSIVDHTVTSGPPIDQTAFPNTPEEGFWSSPPCGGSPCPEWGVFFGESSGGTFFDIGLSTHLRTRCVR